MATSWRHSRQARLAVRSRSLTSTAFASGTPRFSASSDLRISGRTRVQASLSVLAHPGGKPGSGPAPLVRCTTHPATRDQIGWRGLSLPPHSAPYLTPMAENSTTGDLYKAKTILVVET
jgi:hypothetical protein